MTEVRVDDAKVQGITVKVPAPYVEGHPLTKAEAEALNSYFSNRITGGVAPEVKELLGERKYSELSADEQGDTYDKVQGLIDDFARSYQFGVRSAGRKADPLATETMNIARDLVRANLKQKGVNLTTVSNKRVSELAKQVLGDKKKAAKIQERAQKVIAERNELSSLSVDVDL